MSKTAVADVIIPEIFMPYVIQRTAQLSVFAESGIIATDTEMDLLANGGGATVDMPFWNDLTGGRQIIKDDTNLTVNKIGAGLDKAQMHNDANAWSVNLLAKLLSGDDPMAAIGDLIGAYWAREDESMLISSLKGVFAAFAAEGTPPNILSIASETSAGQSEDTKLTGLTFIDALQQLGDRADRLQAIGMHSATEAALRKRDLIDFLPDSQGVMRIKTFQGRTVVVDDTLPVRDGATDAASKVYTSYLFGPGAFAKGNANLAGQPLQGGFGTEAVEFAREALASDNVMINRRRIILHPRGVKWLGGTMAAKSPTNAELEIAGNWLRVYESKNVRMVSIQHNN